ncbi:CST complex subunit CTC1 isoform X1 [Microcaecilia unicolor]|uniref:CST complex subunit CTC1 n=1 Tax=Microcaecilia unicolor TaxID=1415580 RepID=A0A6P7X112_9AMPH|nr:CST complex subunit CTC1 isoform X1 [Microcaecilia unicolor]
MAEVTCGSMEAREAGASCAVSAGLCGPHRTEECWLQAGCTFAERWLFTEGPSLAEDIQQFREGILRCLCRSGKQEEGRLGLPVSYSFVSVSELKSQQRSPCCSHLFWSTDQYNKWTRQGEALLHNQKALPRACLLLIGYLTDQASVEKARRVDGSLYVRDKSSAMPCEMLHFSLDLLDQLLLFPGWSYLPAQHSSGGYLEILAPPISISPKPERLISSEGQPINVLYPHAAVQLLHTRTEGRFPPVNVAGELCRYSSLLDLRGRIFFTLFLKCFSTDHCVPVLVQDPTKISWHFSLSVGSRYVITRLHVTVVQRSKHRLLQVSTASRLFPFSEGQVWEQELPPEALLSQNRAPSKAEVNPQDSKGSLEDTLTPKIKLSKVISYKGTVTKVLNARAGLYEVDGSICVCVAYQQLVNCGRGLRPGARIEMRDVHFLQRPSPHFPLVVLCCCLQSVILIQEFSSLCSAHQPFYTSRNLFVSLLLKHHLGLPQYLWLVKTVKDLQDKFCPHFIKQHQLEASVGTIAHRITEEVLVPILRSLSPSEHRCRNVEEEIAVVEQHQCPLTKYSPLKGPCEVLSLSQLYADAERQGWERLCLPQLLPSSQAQYMNTQELNRSLAWSFLTLDAQDFQPQCILLGVLRSSSRSGSLQLQDESRSVPCLIIKRGRACCSHFTDTGFIGNMLLMERFQVVVERFIRSDFPSWRQLASPEYVREKRSRVYIQFYMEDAVNLGQSGAVSRLHQLPREVKLQSAPHEIPAEPVASKDQPSKRQAEPDPSFHVPLKAKVARVMEAGEATRTEHLGDAEATCAEHQGGGKSDEIGRQGSVSQLFLLVHKEGLLLRNCTPIQGDGTRDIGQQERLTLQLSFQATVVWVGKPRAEPGDTQESPEIIDGDWERLREPQRVLLLFTGKSIRWFPVLHPDCLYRLIIPRCSDVGVFKRLCAPTVPVKTQHLFNCPLLLVVPENWKLHYVTLLESLIEHQDLYQTLARGRPELHSVAEILQPKFTRSLVSFVGEIAERTLCEPERKSWIPTSLSKGRDEGVFLPWEYTLKLTVRDTSSSRSTLHVYINSSVPLLLGLLPKAQVHFYNLERKTSKLNNVYCKFVACSSFSVMELPSHPALRSAALDSESPPPDSSLPMMFLSQLMLQPEQSSRGRSVCHVVCVLSLGLNWLCSHCGSAFVNGSCSRTGPTCSSKTPVFQAYAKIIIEDGSTEAHVMCRNHQVSALLHLPPSEWEGLQQHVLKKGHVYIHHRGWSVEHKCTEAPDEDLLTKYLRKLCLSPLICRPVLLSFRPHQQGKEASHTDSVQTRTFGLGRYEYRTHIPAPLLLMCLELQEVDYKALCHLSSHRIRMAGLGLLPAPECSATRPP